MILKNIMLSFILLMTMLTSFYSISSLAINYNEGAASIPNVCDSTLFGKNDPSGACKNRGTTSVLLKDQIVNLVNSINSFLFVLVPSIAVIAVIVGAFNILQNSVKVGIAIIQWALIGMVVVLLSSAIISAVVKIFVGG